MSRGFIKNFDKSKARISVVVSAGEIEVLDSYFIA